MRGSRRVRRTSATVAGLQSHELDILQHQHKEQLGIYSDVFSDASVQVGQGLMTKVVTDVEGDWHFAKRKASCALRELRPVHARCVVVGGGRSCVLVVVACVLSWWCGGECAVQ